MRRHVLVIVAAAAGGAVVGGGAAWLALRERGGRGPAAGGQEERPEAMKPPETPPPSYLTTEQDPPTEAQPELTRRLIATRKAEDMGEVAGILLDAKKDAACRNEAANLLRRSGYAGLTGDLIKALDSPAEGPLFRSYCVQHLWTSAAAAGPAEKKRIIGVLRGALADRHVRVRREALLALCRLKDAVGREAAVKWLSAKEGAGARDVAVRCVEELGLREQAPAVRKLAGDPDESTAVQAIGTLGRWGDEASRKIFEAAAKSPSARLQAAGRAALRRLEEPGRPAAGAAGS